MNKVKSDKEKEIARLKELIAQGDEFERMGYGCGTMNAINRKLLADLENEDGDGSKPV